MNQLATHIAQRIEKEGGNTSAVARSLGVSSQLLGKYAKGEFKPKAAFFQKWKEVYKEDLLALTRQGGNEVAIDTRLESMATDLMKEKALTKTLLHAFAKAEARATGQPVEEILDDLERTTKIHLKELIRASS